MAVLRRAIAAGPAGLAAMALLFAALTLPGTRTAAARSPGAPPDEAGSDAVAGPPEYRVKAAFLYNFARFVEWPPGVFESSDAPIVVGVLGRDPFGPALDETLAGKSVNGRPFVARRFADLRHLQPCAILFISDLDSRELEEALRVLREAPVLTVGEGRRFARLGGIVSFFVLDRRVRFEIDAEAARRAGLKIGSSLLELGRAVQGPEHADH